MAEKSEIVLAIKQICQEKNLSYEAVLEALNAAMAVAYRKDFADANTNVKANFYPESGDVDVFDVKTVVDDSLKPTEEELAAAETANALPIAHRSEGREVNMETYVDPVTGALMAPPKRFNPKTDILFSDAVKIKKDTFVGDEIVTKLEPPTEFGRVAAMTARQMIIQKLREAERNAVISEYKDKEGTMVSGMVQRVEPRGVIVDLGHAQALMPPEEQIRRERYASGDKTKVFVVSVGSSPRGPEVIVSRSHPDMVRWLFSSEVPEIASGLVEIKSIAREAGSRTKVAVVATTESIDPIGACVGQRGSRVQVIISELAGEKIDIIPWTEDAKDYIAASLAPAKVISVELEGTEGFSRKAKVIVPDDQLSLAIGRGGQNVRLASRLTGYAIDIAGEGSGIVDIASFVREADEARRAEREGIAPAQEAAVEAAPAEETPVESAVIPEDSIETTPEATSAQEEADKAIEEKAAE